MDASAAPHFLSVAGPSRPGLLGDLLAALAEPGVEVLDFLRTPDARLLSVDILFRVTGGAETEDLSCRRFLSKIQHLGLAWDLVPSRSGIAPWRCDDEALVLTIVSDRPAAPVLGRMATVAGNRGAEILSIRRLSAPDLRVAEIHLGGAALDDPGSLRRDLLLAAEELGIDAGITPESPHRLRRRIAFFDMDSTLVQGETIDMLAEAHGVGEQVAAVTRAAMEGREDFESALRRRVRLLAGLPEAALHEVASRIRPTPGAEETLDLLTRLGFRLGLVSGGFTFFVEPLARRFGFHHAFANTLEVREGRLTGELLGDIVDAPAKARHLLATAAAEGVPREQLVAVGDGANDIPMLEAAGLGVAFRAKEAARRSADAIIQRDDLRALSYLLGVSDLERARIPGGTSWIWD